MKLTTLEIGHMNYDNAVSSSYTIKILARTYLRYSIILIHKSKFETDI